MFLNQVIADISSWFQDHPIYIPSLDQLLQIRSFIFTKDSTVLDEPIPTVIM